MTNRIENILLGLLWLLAATLATSFWFNSVFGFNIFATPHWQYLAHLQAMHTPVTPSFYISLGIAIFITISGLYLLLQPKFKRIRLPILKTNQAKPDTTQNTVPQQSPTPAAPQPAPIPAQQQQVMPTVSVPETKPADVKTDTPNQTPIETPAPAVAVAPLRPPRLNLPTSYSQPPQSAPVAPTATDIQNQAQKELEKIFTDAGYTVKKPPFINGKQPVLFAIGTNETLWVGTLDQDTGTTRHIIDKLNEVFTETLEDIYININGFAINAPDAQTTEFEDILVFDKVSDVEQYIKNLPNPEPDAEEKENFNAYSEYIDTVIGFIGKI